MLKATIKHWLGIGQKKYDVGLWESGLAPEVLQDVYDKQGWEGRAGEYRHRSVERLVANIDSLYRQLGRPVTLLDVACFSGDYFGQLMQHQDMAKMLKYTGADVTPKYVGNCKRRWAAYPNATFQVGSALSLPFPDRSFDIVFNSGMLIHIDDAAGAIGEFIRVASRMVLIQTTVDKDQKPKFIDENKSGPKFIDRIYRYDYIRDLIAERARIVAAVEVPAPPDYTHLSVLFEANVI